MNLVKFDCGCVGLAPPRDDDTGSALIIYACDSDDAAYGAGTRDMSGKSFAPLPADVCARHWKNINRLIGNGYNYRDVVRLLGPSPARLHDDR